MNINLTLFLQMIAFAVFVWFCMKFVWPPIVAALAERKTKIAEGLAAAERGHQEQHLGQLITAAKAEIEQETNRAREALRGKVAELALAAAAKILDKEIDASAHKALVESFAKQI